jgi:hypothetical protein
MLKALKIFQIKIQNSDILILQRDVLFNTNVKNVKNIYSNSIIYFKINYDFAI